MKPSVYIETTIIGYLAMRPSHQLVTAANQRVTQDFWFDHRSRFELFVSESVLDECAAGDPEAANERGVFLRDIPVLEFGEDVEKLALALFAEIQLPDKAKLDATHIAFSSVNGMKYLVTWNCKHIANPELRAKIENVCKAAGYEAPVICTPLELIEVITHE